MLNRLPDLEEQDIKYNLHVGAEPINDYNISLIYHDFIPHELMVPQAPLQDAATVRKNLEKLGIFF